MSHKSRKPLPPQSEFVAHLARNFAFAAVLIAGAMFLGTVGYRYTENMDWLDAMLNAAMILTGMGPVAPMHTTAGKLFAAGYALFSGVFFLSVVALALSPAVRRLMHRFHLETET